MRSCSHPTQISRSNFSLALSRPRAWGVIKDYPGLIAPKQIGAIGGSMQMAQFEIQYRPNHPIIIGVRS
jgi:hypothetical protein